MSQTKDAVDRATSLLALSLLNGVGSKALGRIARTFSDPRQAVEASEEDVGRLLDDRKLARLLHERSGKAWDTALRDAQTITERHQQHEVIALTLGDTGYPPLLSHIDINDAQAVPPAVLYVKGNVEALQQTDSIAVIGTREPTERGRQVARIVAQRFVAMGCVIVSGLAKGIDTAGHLGALDAGGITIAVMGTPLDKVYPAENKRLAERICAEGGALVSEYPFGHAANRGNFVQRDRIQAGLSLAIIVVQTRRDGGSMHTAEFAQQYSRLVLCPKPLEAEAGAEQYEGVRELIETRKALEFQQQDYDHLQKTYMVVKEQILGAVDVDRERVLGADDQRGARKPASKRRAASDGTGGLEPPQPTTPTLWNMSLKSEVAQAQDWSLNPGRDTQQDARVIAIEKAILSQFPEVTPAQFDALVTRVRARLFSPTDHLPPPSARR